MSVWKLSELSGKFPDYLETFQTVWKLSRPSKNFPRCPETFNTVWKLSTLVHSSAQLVFRVNFMGNLVNERKTFRTSKTVWKLSRLSGNFPHCQENFQTIWKLSGPRNFPDRLETFQAVLKLSRQSGNSPHLFTLQFSWCLE